MRSRTVVDVTKSGALQQLARTLQGCVNSESPVGRSVYMTLKRNQRKQRMQYFSIHRRAQKESAIKMEQDNK